MGNQNYSPGVSEGIEKAMTDTSDLHLACRNGNAEKVRKIVEKGAVDVNKLGEYQGIVMAIASAAPPEYRFSTPLCIAIGNGHYDCVEELLKSPNIDIGENFIDAKEGKINYANRNKLEHTPIERVVRSRDEKLRDLFSNHIKDEVQRKLFLEEFEKMKKRDPNSF